MCVCACVRARARKTYTRILRFSFKTVGQILTKRSDKCEITFTFYSTDRVDNAVLCRVIGSSNV